MFRPWSSRRAARWVRPRCASPNATSLAIRPTESQACHFRGYHLTEGGPGALAEEGQPVKRLPAVDEAQIAIGNGITPAAHLSGGDLLLEHAFGRIRTVDAQLRGVHKQRPTPGRGDHGEAP